YVYADGTMYSPSARCAYKCGPIEDIFVTVCGNIMNDPVAAGLYRLAYPEQTYTTCEGSISYLGTMIHYNDSPYYGETQYTVEGTGYEWSADGHYYAQLTGDSYAAEAFIYGGLDMFAEHGEKLIELDPKAETVTDSAGRPTVCNYTSGYECRLSQKMMKDLAMSLLYSYGTMPDSSVTAEAKDGVYTLTINNGSCNTVVGIDSRGTVVRLYEAMTDYSTNETEVNYDYTFEPVYDSTAFHMPQLKSDLAEYAEDCLNDYLEKSVSGQ
ncbi:MAG: hypothetical protein IJM44_02150, partial [Ruminococcus sp.]|nr:hypothetical protein [Ruminococcus sp.]